MVSRFAPVAGTAAILGWLMIGKASAMETPGLYVNEMWGTVEAVDIRSKTLTIRGDEPKTVSGIYRVATLTELRGADSEERIAVSDIQVSHQVHMTFYENHVIETLRLYGSVRRKPPRR